MAEPVDAVVVGAGPAGSAAALALARAGRSVILLERGPFPGSKNVYGGVVYARVLDDVLPCWWERVPVQRWVVRRSTMVMTPTQALTIDVRTQAWGQPPYNGMTTYRADFDSWLAGEAVAAGARLVTSTVATGLRRDPAGRITGVRTDRPDGDLEARVVIACDGVNSLLAREAGLAAAGGPRPLHPRGQGGAGPAGGGHRGALRAGARRGARHRDGRLHGRHPGRRLPLHQSATPSAWGWWCR